MSIAETSAISPAFSALQQAPTAKFGTLVPNRIFVGGIAPNTTEEELKEYFSVFGAVKDAKIINDRVGVSKGYGFVTFETTEDAEKMLKKEGETLVFKERKLNIGKAIRKQYDNPIFQNTSFARFYGMEVSDPSLAASGSMLFTSSSGVPYTYQNGTAIFQGTEGGYPVAVQQSYPVMVSPTPPLFYQQYAYQSSATQAPNSSQSTQWSPSTHGQWRWAAGSPAGSAMHSQYVYAQALPQEIYNQQAAQSFSAELQSADQAQQCDSGTASEGASAAKQAKQSSAESQDMPVSSEGSTLYAISADQRNGNYKKSLSSMHRSFLSTIYAPHSSSPKMPSGLGPPRYISKSIAGVPMTLMGSAGDVDYPGCPLTPPATPDNP